MTEQKSTVMSDIKIFVKKVLRKGKKILIYPIRKLRLFFHKHTSKTFYTEKSINKIILEQIEDLNSSLYIINFRTKKQNDLLTREISEQRCILEKQSCIISELKQIIEEQNRKIAKLSEKQN